MVFVLIIVILMIAVFFAIISHFGDASINNMETDDTSSTVNYIPKKFLSNNEYNFLTKFIDLENELHVHIVP